LYTSKEGRKNYYYFFSKKEGERMNKIKINPQLFFCSSYLWSFFFFKTKPPETNVLAL